MLTKTKIALATVLVLATVSGAMARGSYGSVMPGSLDGVNPADHARIFDNANTARSYGFVKSQNGWTVEQPQRAQ
jgi:hypothetical protein